MIRATAGAGHGTVGVCRSGRGEEDEEPAVTLVASMMMVSGEARAPGAFSLDGPVPPSWLEVEAQRRLLRTPRPRRAAVPFAQGDYPRAVLARAGHAWASRGADKHHSALIYARLAGVAAQAAASLEAQAVLVSMAQDELRHAALCREIACAAGVGDQPAMPVMPSAHIAISHPLEELLRQLLYGTCLAEAASAALLADAATRARDPFVRQALRQLAADEAMHARFGRELVAQHGPAVRRDPALLPALNRFLSVAFAALERDLLAAVAREDRVRDDDMEVGDGGDAAASDLRALGMLNRHRTAELLVATVEQEIAPALARLGFAAVEAWQTRAAAPLTATERGAAYRSRTAP